MPTNIGVIDGSSFQATSGPLTRLGLQAMKVRTKRRLDAWTGSPALNDRCPITQEREVWRLQGPCTIDATLELPEGVALDGQGMAIMLYGEPEQFDSAGVRIAGAAIRDVIIDGQGLQPICPLAFSALFASGSTEVENVTVLNIGFGSACQSGVGVEVAVFDGETALLRQVTISHAHTGILLAGNGRAAVTGCTVRSASSAITLANSVDVAITGVTTEAVEMEMCITGQARATIPVDAQPVRHPVITVHDKGMATVGNVTVAGFGSRERALAPFTQSVSYPPTTSPALATLVPHQDSGGKR